MQGLNEEYLLAEDWDRVLMLAYGDPDWVKTVGTEDDRKEVADFLREIARRIDDNGR